MIFNPDLQRMKRTLATLVAINTENPPGHEVAAAQALKKILVEMGFIVTLFEYKPGRVNVVAKYENGEGPTFAFNTHIDTVPAGEGWSSDPFTLREAEGRLYGRGSCDAKGPMTGMLEAAYMLLADTQKWSGSLYLIFTADEEVASEGAKDWAVNHPIKIDYAVIGEPTSNVAYIAHKGSLRPIVRLHGVTAHSGTPELGVNAIYAAAKLLGMIEEHHQKYVCHHSHPMVGNASLTVTRINGGHADNVIPNTCDLLLDRRLIPGESEEAAKEDIKSLLKKAESMFGIKTEILGYKPTTGGATETALDSKIVKESLAACEKYNPNNGGPKGFQGACDLVHFRSLGTNGTVIGPGGLNVAHTPNEFVPINELFTSSKIYAEIALNMLQVKNNA